MPPVPPGRRNCSTCCEDCIGSFPVLLPQVNNAPAATMTGWLMHRTLPDDLTAGEDCELREPGEEGGVVRCRGVDLLSEEVETHLHAGKQVARLALAWEDRLSTGTGGGSLVLRRLKFSDELMKENEEIPEADTGRAAGCRLRIDVRCPQRSCRSRIIEPVRRGKRPPVEHINGAVAADTDDYRAAVSQRGIPMMDLRAPA